MQSASEVLEREFLDARAKILILAATLDRIDRAGGSVDDDSRVKKIHTAIQMLGEPGPNRAEKIQLLFSRPYEESWRESYGLK